LFTNTKIYKPFLLKSSGSIWKKTNHLPKHHGAGPPDTQGPMQCIGLRPALLPPNLAVWAIV